MNLLLESILYVQLGGWMLIRRQACFSWWSYQCMFEGACVYLCVFTFEPAHMSMSVSVRAP